jgi:uncharacterized membrane protein
MFYLKLFAIAFPVFMLLDFLWLGWLMNAFYLQEFGSLARRSETGLTPYWPSAIVCYILLVAALVLYVLPPFAGRPLGLDLFLWGALFGFIFYGMYEFTNHAVLANWPWKMLFVDTAWGALLYGTSALVTGWIARWFGIL